MKDLAAGRYFRTRTKGQGRKSVTPPRLAIDATVEEKSSEAGPHNRTSSKSLLPSAILQLLASITLLSRVVDFFRECSVAVGTMSGRSQQPGPDRFQDLLQRQTRSFFLPQGRWSG